MFIQYNHILVQQLVTLVWQFPKDTLSRGIVLNDRFESTLH